MNMNQEEKLQTVFPQWNKNNKHLVVQVRAEYPDVLKSISEELQRFHSVNAQPIETVKEGNHIHFILPETPYNTVDSVQRSLKDFAGLAYAADNVIEKDNPKATFDTKSIKSIREKYHPQANTNSLSLKNN